jgi:hypothetical protein
MRLPGGTGLISVRIRVVLTDLSGRLARIHTEPSPCGHEVNGIRSQKDASIPIALGVPSIFDPSQRPHQIYGFLTIEANAVASFGKLV